jgi:hypothetical protein
MFKKILFLFIFIFLFLLYFFVFAGQYEEENETGVLSIYFQDEKVGYEEYTWQSDEMSYLLSVKGRMTKPVDMEIHSLLLRLDKSFIPRQFNFKFTVGGVAQEISSLIVDGQVENTIYVSGQQQKSVLKIKRDAFLLPNPVFAEERVENKEGCLSFAESCFFLLYGHSEEIWMSPSGTCRTFCIYYPSVRSSLFC